MVPKLLSTYGYKHSKVDQKSALIYKSRDFLGQMPTSSSKMLFRILFFHDDLYSQVSYSNIESQYEIFKIFHQKWCVKAID